MNVILPADSSSHCPLQKLVTRNQSTDVYAPVTHTVSLDPVLVGCSRETTNQDSIVGPSSCLSLSNNASQLWYLVLPYTDMSTLPMGCEVVAKGIPIPYTYDKNGPKEQTFFRRSLFNGKANRAINLGEIAFNWNLNNITSACQRCEQEGKHCGFSSNRGQAFCLHHGIVFQPRSHNVCDVPFKVVPLLMFISLASSVSSKFLSLPQDSCQQFNSFMKLLQTSLMGSATVRSCC
jgi:hypothetical protein